MVHPFAYFTTLTDIVLDRWIEDYEVLLGLKKRERVSLTTGKPIEIDQRCGEHMRPAMLSGYEMAKAERDRRQSVKKIIKNIRG